MNTQYKALFIDFYGTLAAGDVEVVEAVCHRIVRELNLDLTGHQLVTDWGNRFFATIDRRNHDQFRTLYECECESLVETLEPILGPIDPTPYVDQLTEYWCAPELHPETIDVLNDLNLPICCVSNADTDHLAAAVARHNLPLDHVVSSEDARAYKPDGKIFQLALSNMNLAPSDVLHVGDSLHSDVHGAKQAGIDALWLARDRRIYDIGQHAENHKIKSLNELRDILA